MVVGVLTSSYPRFPGDAAGSFVGDDVRRLLRRGCTVQVLAAGEGPCGVTRTWEGDVAVTRISPGVAAPHSLFYADGAPEALERGGIRPWAQAVHFSGALAREARVAASRWDAVISHWLVPCGWAATMAAPTRPHRCHAHSGDVALLERLPFGRALAQHLARSGPEIVFASRDLQERFAILVEQPAGARPGKVGRLVPDVELFRRASRADRETARRQLGVQGPTIVSAGRLVPIKGFDVLLDALGALPEVAEGVEVVILGAGPERQALWQLARRHKVSLRLPGAIPRAEVARWLTAADLYVQPSRVLPSGRTEGLPVATLEALAVGLPVIAARSGGLADLDQEDGRVSFFEPGDVDSLRRVLSSACGRLSPLPIGRRFAG